MTVSVPEKTLEHWASIYLTYRYRSKAALWWPVDGEDIDVQGLPRRPGKVVQLELKTTVAQIKQHKVMVDLSQLSLYCRRPFAKQPFYVFPRPHWQGDLRAAARAAHRHETDLAFSRSGLTWWFAEWMVVLTTAQVAAVVAPELSAWKRGGGGVDVPMVRYRHPTASRPQGQTIWGSGTTPAPKVVPWRGFWSEIENCGRTDWPQLVQVPKGLVSRGASYRPAQVLELLREAAGLRGRELASAEWVSLGTDGGDAYIVVDQGDGLDEVSLLESSLERSHRTAIFLDARALG